VVKWLLICLNQKLENELGDTGEDAILNKLLDQLENSSEFGGVMENVMKQLLSKEVIQEPLEKLKEQVFLSPSIARFLTMSLGF